jgi:N-acetylneuraminic acid mutarotase
LFWREFGDNGGVISRVFVPLVLLAVLAVSCAGDDGGSWRTLAPMPTPRAGVAVAAVSFRIYVVGGFEADGSASSKVEVYDTQADAWKELAPLPAARHHAVAAEWHSNLFVFGGMDSTNLPTSTVFVYDMLRDQWDEWEDMASQHGAPAIAIGTSTRSSPYVISGLEENSNGSFVNTPTVETYLVDYWLPVTDIATPRDGLAAAVVDGVIYAVGGRVNGDISQNTGVNEAYGSDGTNEWVKRAPMPTARSSIAAAAVGGKIYVFGGESPQGIFDKSDMYDPGTDAWRAMASMPTARHSLGAVAIANTIYVIGGSTKPGLSVSGVNEAYTPPQPY